jgi:hypothetical protein
MDQHSAVEKRAAYTAYRLLHTACQFRLDTFLTRREAVLTPF